MVLARAEELSRKGKNVINLGIGQPDFKTANHSWAAIKALKTVITDIHLKMEY